MTAQKATIEYYEFSSTPWLVNTGDEWDCEEFATLAEAQTAFPEAELAPSAERAIEAGLS